MQSNTLKPGAGWSWLMRGIRITFRYPKAMLGAAAYFLLLFMAVSFVLGFIQALVLILPSLWWVPFGLSMVTSMCMYPILTGGFFRMIDGLVHDREAGPSMLLAPLHKDSGGGRLARLGLIMLLVYLGLFAIIYLTFGREVIDWYVQTLSMQAAGTRPDAIAPIPEHFFAVILGIVVPGGVLTLVQVLATAHVALLDASPMAALAATVRGMSRNLLPVLMLGLGILIMSIAYLVVMIVCMMLAGLTAAAVSPILGVVIGLMCYVALLLLSGAVLTGVVYAMWADITGSGQRDEALGTISAIEA